MFKEFQLNVGDVYQVVHNAPQSEVELQVLIPNIYEKLSEGQIEAILQLIAEYTMSK